MQIFVDESGTFTHSSEQNSWCVVVAYVALEHKRRGINNLMAQVREIGNSGRETKLKHLSEEKYIWFLTELKKLGGLVFSVAVDIGLHRPEEITQHRDRQAEKIIEHREKLIHESARQDISNLSTQVYSLPPQLYTQLICQLELFHEVLTQATLYYVQHHPPALANFRWRLDRKDKTPTAYEKTFQTILPKLLQSMSLAKPMQRLEDADYSHFTKFEYPLGQEPTYLKDQYGIDAKIGPSIGKMINEDFKLADSAITPGIQIADLLASGIRRLLRGEFHAEDKIAILLGTNMLQPLKDKHTIRMISLDKSANTPKRLTRLIHLMNSSARPMIKD
jgi:hypothetical protein